MKRGKNMRMHGLFNVGRVIGVVASVVLAATAGGQVDCARWAAPFGASASFAGTPRCATVWDADGSGPGRASLIIGGAFDGFSSDFEENIRIWDGQRWSRMGNGLTGSSSAQVNAVGTWDPDGSGPLPREVVAVGTFTRAGPVVGAETVNYVARWDGTTWRAMGTGLGGTSPTPYGSCLTEWDPDGDGPATPLLIVGGRFSSAGGVAAKNIAAWDGASWQPVGVGMGSSVTALTTWDADGPGGMPARLVAGGPTTTGSGATVNGVAVWNGVNWSACGAGLGFLSAVQSLASWDIDGPGGAVPALVVGGVIDTAGGVPVGNVAMWNGQAWSSVGGGVSVGSPLRIYSMQEWPNPDGGPTRLVVAGDFQHAGGVAVDCIASWDGTSWTAFDDGNPIIISALVMYDRDGAGPGGETLTGAGIWQFSDFSDQMYAMTWEGSKWHPVSSGLSGMALALTAWDPDGAGPEGKQVVVGGGFGFAGSECANGIARWDGSAWRTIGDGFDGEVKAVLAWDAGGGTEELIAGGYFNRESESARSLARWDGSAWRSLGSELSDDFPPVVHALARWDPDGPGGDEPLLIVGGGFELAGGITVNNIAAWNGSSWEALGAGRSSGVNALAVWDPDGAGPQNEQLFAGGGSLARWDGAQWVTITPALNSTVYSLATWDRDGDGPGSPLLIVGGKFSRAGTLTANSIAAWDGAAWRLLSSGMTGAPSGYSTSVNALASWTAVAGGVPLLAAGGIFTHAGGTSVNGVAVWNGLAWKALGSGVDSFPNVTSLLSFPTSAGSVGYRDLVVGGQFTIATGVQASRIAAWSERDCCPVDLTGDGVVDFGDYLEFLNLFDALDPRVDFNHDGVIDFGDYLEFLNLFDAGC